MVTLNPPGCPALMYGNEPFMRQVEAVADVLVIARMVGKVPRRAVDWLPSAFWIGPSLLE